MSTSHLENIILNFTKHVYYKFFLKILLLVLLVVNFSLSGLSQPLGGSKKTDSLKALLAVKSGADKFDILYELLRENLGRDINYSFEIANQAEKLALELSDSLRIVKAQFVKEIGRASCRERVCT